MEVETTLLVLFIIIWSQITEYQEAGVRLTAGRYPENLSEAHPWPTAWVTSSVLTWSWITNPAVRIKARPSPTRSAYSSPFTAWPSMGSFTGNRHTFCGGPGVFYFFKLKSSPVSPPSARMHTRWWPLMLFKCLGDHCYLQHRKSDICCSKKFTQGLADRKRLSRRLVTEQGELQYLVSNTYQDSTLIGATQNGLWDI